MVRVLLLLAYAVTVLSATNIFGFHRIPEGHVGVYWRGGALLDHVTNPGFHTALPFITQYAAVQVTVQTDKVTNIPCGTSGGTVITFDRVEVVNQLTKGAVHEIIKNYTVYYDQTWIYDKIHHEINQFCSQHTLQQVYIDEFDKLDETLKDTLQRDIDIWAPGLRILSIRVTKPRIPTHIQKNYEEIEHEITRLKVAEQTQRLVEKQAETERKKALIEAEKHAMVEAIALNITLARKENELQLQRLENELQSERSKAEADAAFYRAQKEAEANKLRLTPELLHLETVRALSNNTKVFFGEKIPNMFVDTHTLGQTQAAQAGLH